MTRVPFFLVKGRSNKTNLHYITPRLNLKSNSWYFCCALHDEHLMGHRKEVTGRFWWFVTLSTMNFHNENIQTCPPYWEKCSVSWHESRSKNFIDCTINGSATNIAFWVFFYLYQKDSFQHVLIYTWYLRVNFNMF